MKRLILAGIAGLAALMTVTSANAADIARRQAMPTKAPAYFAPYNWTGFYVGINGGGGFGDSEWSNAFGSTGSFDVSGGLVGGTIGYNWQMNQFVFGFEGDMDWSGIKGSTSSGICAGLSCETRNRWLGTARARIGYAFDRFMPYVTGGLAVGDVKSSISGFGDSSDTQVGWTVGGGLEASIAGPWTAKIEYLFVDLGNMDCDSATCGVILGAPTDVDFHTNIVRAGVNYRF
jgi:outer membrane immunogenic protein